MTRLVAAVVGLLALVNGTVALGQWRASPAGGVGSAIGGGIAQQPTIVGGAARDNPQNKVGTATIRGRYTTFDDLKLFDASMMPPAFCFETLGPPHAAAVSRGSASSTFFGTTD